MWVLTHWGRVTHIYISKVTNIGSDSGLSPGMCQAIIWINAGIMSIQTLGTHFNEILSEIHIFSFMKIHLKMSPVKWCTFHLGLSVLRLQQHVLEVKDIAGWIFWGNTSMYLHSIITAPPISPTPPLTLTHTHHKMAHGCWWPGDARSQVITSRGIGLILMECCSLAQG